LTGLANRARHSGNGEGIQPEVLVEEYHPEFDAIRSALISKLLNPYLLTPSKDI
jgi:hypothetical protein